jgi:putative oxidoreductase
MNNFPFISLKHSIVLLRVCLAVILIAHAVVRITGGTIDRFAGFLDGKGFIMSTAIVWLITLFELVGGALLALGYFTRWMATGFILEIAIGIVIIHWSNGWWVGEHGSGGMEYSVLIIVALVAVMARDKPANQ